MRALEKPVEPRITMLRLSFEAELQDGEAADARDSIRRDTASLDTAGTDTEDLDPFEGIEEDEDKLEANEVLLEDC